MVTLLTERIRNNDDNFFKKFTRARCRVEAFLMENKSLIGVIVQNLSSKQRVPKISDLLMYLVTQFNNGRDSISAVTQLLIWVCGAASLMLSQQRLREFTDETKSTIFVRKALESAIECPICGGKLDLENQFPMILVPDLVTRPTVIWFIRNTGIKS